MINSELHKKLILSNLLLGGFCNDYPFEAHECWCKHTPAESAHAKHLKTGPPDASATQAATSLRPAGKRARRRQRGRG